MTTRWQDESSERFVNPLTVARPPAQPRNLDLLCVLVWVAAPLAFWLIVGALTLYLLGVL